jgi:hypothetical protein
MFQDILKSLLYSIWKSLYHIIQSMSVSESQNVTHALRRSVQIIEVQIGYHLACLAMILGSY